MGFNEHGEGKRYGNSQAHCERCLSLPLEKSWNKMEPEQYNRLRG